MEKVTVLMVDYGQQPIHKEKLDLSTENLKQTLLELLNKFGKNAYVLLKYKDEFYTINHTAHRGQSKTYHKARISYHPYLKEIGNDGETKTV